MRHTRKIETNGIRPETVYDPEDPETDYVCVLPLLRFGEKTMASISSGEVLAHAEGVCKLIRARKHLANRGAERACVRLLDNVIKKAERELFKPNYPSLLSGDRAAGSRQRSKHSLVLPFRRVL